ncbi:hypothetical protein GOP47_0025492 [Adiantum capillus-veneris]|uniref:Uncharacterized protein n=1 Tax=Adiantum capillus-veneris TaxID=13818 RepID=A0A9D4U0P8_ADICA|nr:hypothetical protein GOP47_0025492 [Adiantum capillus-veneris]
MFRKQVTRRTTRPSGEQGSVGAIFGQARPEQKEGSQVGAEEHGRVQEPAGDGNPYRSWGFGMHEQVCRSQELQKRS